MKAERTERNEKRKPGGIKKVLKIIGIVIAAFFILSIAMAIFVPSSDRITGTEEPKSGAEETPGSTERAEETPGSIEQAEEEDPANISFDGAGLLVKSGEVTEIPGSYTTADGYQIEIRESTDGTAYPFAITFSLAGRNYVTGTMAFGKEVTFENNGFESCDGGKLTFYQKDGAIYLKYAGEVNGSFDTLLKRKVIKDYSDYNLDDYTGTYYSPTEAYEVKLMATPGRSFFVELRYASGTEDYGDAVPGVESTLENGATVTVNINDDKTLHITLVSAVRADGIFDEDLIPGELGEVTEIHSAKLLEDLSEKTKFAYLCEIEQRCKDLRVSNVTSQPSAYCDNEIYRFAGKVVQTVEGGFLLQLCNRSDCENNLIVCRCDETVQAGERICVYGSGVGTSSYTRTYDNGVVKEYETLLLDVGYTIRNDISYGQAVPEFMQDFVYGKYSLEEWSTKYLLESDFTFNGHDINGRDMTIKNVALTYSVTSVTDMIGNSVSIQVSTETTSHRGEPCAITFYFKLNGTGLTYMGKRDSDTIAAMDYAQYDKVN